MLTAIKVPGHNATEAKVIKSPRKMSIFLNSRKRHICFFFDCFVFQKLEQNSTIFTSFVRKTIAMIRYAPLHPIQARPILPTISMTSLTYRTSRQPPFRLSQQAACHHRNPTRPGPLCPCRKTPGTETTETHK